MKRLLITVGAVLAAVNMYGQGVVTFANNGSTSPVTDFVTGVKLAAGSTFQVALFYAPDSATAPDISAMIQIGGPASFGPSAGAFSGGGRTTPTDTAPGGSAWFAVKAWETAFGANYDAAVAAAAQNIGGTLRVAKRGESNVFKSGTGNPPLLPAVVLANSGLQGFAVVVPEPSVIGLGLLGIGALALLRRRN